MDEIDIDESDKAKVAQAEHLIGEIRSLWRLNRINRAWEDRMKALAAEELKPGSDELIEDMDALDYIWDLPGDRVWSSNQTEPFRPKALDYYVGRKVVHIWGTGEVVKIGKTKRRDARYAIKVRMPCYYCKTSRVTVYAQPGCHNGAFCYIYDRQGNYLADLRNQIVVCRRCAEKRRAE